MNLLFCLFGFSFDPWTGKALRPVSGGVPKIMWRTRYAQAVEIDGVLYYQWLE